MPSAVATESASAIIALAVASMSVSLVISAIVERVKALIGLNAKLPSSFANNSLLMCGLIGALNPAFIREEDKDLILSLLEPSSSPSENLSPSICFIIPGSTSSVDG